MLFLFRGALFRTFITYEVIGERVLAGVVDENLISEIQSKTEGKDLSVKQILRISGEITERNLSFTFHKSPNETNEVYREGKANCVGYAALFGAIANYIAKDQRNPIIVTHLVGKLELLGWDMHRLFGNHPFFRDHDFVAITIPDSDTTHYIDPSVSDYLGIKSINVRRQN